MNMQGVARSAPIDGCYRQVTTDAGNSVLLRPNLHRESVDRPVIFVGESEFKIVGALPSEFPMLALLFDIKSLSFGIRTSMNCGTLTIYSRQV